MRPTSLSNGYKQFVIWRAGKRAPDLVHRLVLLTHVGPPPTPLHEAAHNNGDRADNRLENLRWATRRENHADKQQHGTNLAGERHPGSTITNQQARQIYIRLLGGERQRPVARELGIGRSVVVNIARRRSYVEATSGLPDIPVRGRDNAKRASARLSDEVARDAYRRWHAGERAVDLARSLGVSPSVIQSIAKRHTYRAATAGLTPETIAPGSGRLPGAEEQRVRKA